MQANERSATLIVCFFFFQAEDGIRDLIVTGVQTCALPISDTYNHKIKRLDPRTGECRTLLGAGAPGHADGAAGAARFSEPSGVSVAAGRLFIADTNNHAIRVASLASGDVTTLVLRGL